MELPGTQEYVEIKAKTMEGDVCTADERCEATARSSSGSIMVESKVFWDAVGIVLFLFF